MFRQLTILEVKGAEERIHRYECPPATPPGEVYDSLGAMREYLLRFMEEQQKSEKEKAETKIPEGEPEQEHNFTPKDVKCKAL